MERWSVYFNWLDTVYTFFYSSVKTGLTVSAHTIRFTYNSIWFAQSLGTSGFTVYSDNGHSQCIWTIHKSKEMVIKHVWLQFTIHVYIQVLYVAKHVYSTRSDIYMYADNHLTSISKTINKRCHTPKDCPGYNTIRNDILFKLNIMSLVYWLLQLAHNSTLVPTLITCH